MASQYVQIINYGLQNKMNKQQIYDALNKAGSVSPTAMNYMNDLETNGAFGQEEVATTREDIYAFDQNNISTDSSKQSFNYGTRMLQSGDIITDFENDVSQKGAYEGFKQYIDEKQAGGTLTQRFVDPEFQQIDQAQRNFINSVLRRESGAVISDAEFDNARKQYFPVPGDTTATVTQKRVNREQITKNFLGQAGVDATTIYNDNASTAVDDKLNQLHEFSQNNPNDPRSIAFIKDYESGNINMDTGMPRDKKEDLTPAQEYRAKYETPQKGANVQEEEPGAFDTFKEDLQESGAALKENIAGVAETKDQPLAGLGRTQLRATGTVAGALNDVIGASISLVTPDAVEDAVGALIAKGMETDEAQAVIQEWNDFEQEYPQLAKDAKAAGEVGTLLTLKGVGGAATKTVKGVDVPKMTLPKLTKDAVEKNTADLKEITRGTTKMKNAAEQARKAGVKDIEEEISKTGVLKGVVDSDGKITTKGEGGALEQYSEKVIGDLDKLVSQGLKEEGKTVVKADLKKELEKHVKNADILTGSIETKVLKKIEKELDALPDSIPLSQVNDLKRSLYKQINYNNPDTALGDKIMVKGIKQYIEKTSDAVDVKKINTELTQKYAIQEYIEKLDGQIVKGGRLGKYVDSTIGGGAGALTGTAIGSLFGPIGAGVGAGVGATVGSVTGGAMRGARMKTKLNK